MPPNVISSCPEEESKIDLIDYDQIIYCQAHGNYTRLYMEMNKCILICKLLKFYENTLPRVKFIRINRSCIINKNFILQINRNNKVVLKENTELFISKRRKKKVFKELSYSHIVLKT